MSHCHTCKFADWPRRSNGTRNPHLLGHCTWKGKLVVSATTRHPNSYMHKWGEPIEVSGGWIDWKDNITCPVYQMAKQ